MNLAELQAQHAGGDGLALLDLSPARGARALGYRELDRRCGRLAAGLVAAGIRRGARVGVLARNRAEFLEVVFGAVRVGITPVPINAKLPRDAIEFIARDARLELLFVEPEFAGLLPAKVPLLDLDRDYDRFLAADPVPLAELPEQTEGVLLYTSGSSGRPKGVLHTHASQLWMVRALLPPPAFTPPGQRLLVAAPLYHKNGLLSSKLALGMGATIVLLPRFTPEGYLRAIAEQRCTSIGGVPTMFALIARERELLRTLDLGSVQRITIGSAPLTGALLDEVRALFPRAAIVNGYGTTETGAAAFGAHPEGKPTPPVSLGHPIRGVELRLVGGRDENEGELWIRSPGVMTRYLNLAEATQAKLEDGWYKTGDLMRRDPEGFYFFVGRVDDMFVCGGENVFPSEVESLLEKHPAVQQAAVVAIDDHVKGQVPVAFVVLRAGALASEDDLRKFALEHGPAYQHPRRVWFVDALPLAGTHKVDRGALVELAATMRSPER